MPRCNGALDRGVTQRFRRLAFTALRRPQHPAAGQAHQTRFAERFPQRGRGSTPDLKAPGHRRDGWAVVRRFALPYAVWLGTAATVLLSPDSASGSPGSRFRPSAGVNGHVATESSQVLPAWTPAATLLTSYDRTLDDGRRTIRLDRRVSSHVLVAFGIADWTQLDLDLPLALYQGGQTIEAGEYVRLRPASVGDLRVGLKGTILRTPRRGFGLGLRFDITAPTGDADALASYGGPSYAPSLLVEYRAVRGILLDVNLGYLARPEANIDGFVAGDGFDFRAGARIPIAPREQFAAFTELEALPSFVRGGQSPVSLRGGFRWQTKSGMILTPFAGGGLISALGVPQVQFGLGLGYAPPARMRTERAFGKSERPSAVEVARLYDERLQGAAPKPTPVAADDDPDGDGLVAQNDKCPTVAEDLDQFEDADGCPELDNDRDGLRDAVDLCPRVPEIVNGHTDWDGCPERQHADGRFETVDSLAEAELLPAVEFAEGSAKLDDAALEELATLSELLRLNPWIDHVQLRVYVHATKDAQADVRLAQARSEAIQKRLEVDGVQPWRVRALPGKSVPAKTRAPVLLTLSAPPSGLSPLAPNPATLMRWVADQKSRAPKRSSDAPGPTLEAQGPATEADAD